MRIVSMLLVDEVVERADNLLDLYGAPCEWWWVDDIPGLACPNIVMVLSGDPLADETCKFTLTDPDGTIVATHVEHLMPRSAPMIVDGGPRYTTFVAAVPFEVTLVGPYSFEITLDESQVLSRLDFAVALRDPNSLPTESGS